MEAFFDSFDLYVEENDNIILIACCLMVVLYIFWEEILELIRKKQ